MGHCATLQAGTAVVGRRHEGSNVLWRFAGNVVTNNQDTHSWSTCSYKFQCKISNFPQFHQIWIFVN